MKNIPSPWMSLPIEQLKEMKERYKLTNDMQQQAQREAELDQKKMETQQQAQSQALSSQLPFLDRQ